jgi:hypothetical protein
MLQSVVIHPSIFVSHSKSLAVESERYFWLSLYLLRRSLPQWHIFATKASCRAILNSSFPIMLSVHAVYVFMYPAYKLFKYAINFSKTIPVTGCGGY